MVALCSPATGPAIAYVQSNLVDLGGADVGLFVQNGRIVFRLEQDASTGITDGTDLTALRDSMARWTDITTADADVSEGTPFDFVSPVDASDGIGSDASNRLYFAETDTQGRIGGSIAVAFFFVGSNGRIVDCDIVMNERLYDFSTRTPANPNERLGTSTYDIGEIATHEIGHCLGLGHSPIAGRFSNVTGLQVSGFNTTDFTYQATMFPFGTRTIQGRSLSQDDISGASFIYPNGTLAATTGTISGRVLEGLDSSPIKGAHVVAVSASAPDIPVVGALSDVEAGGPGGEYTLVGLAPGDYYIRIEPMVGTTNPFTEDNVHFVGFDTAFPWEFYNGPGESDSDDPADRAVITVAAGQTVSGIDIRTNVAADDPNEPNDTAAAATPIACGAQQQVSILPSGDVDYYSLPVTEPTVLLVDVSASRIGSTLNPIAGIFDAAGTLIALEDDTASLDPILQVTLFETGTYLVAIASYNDTGFDGSNSQTVGDYTMNVGCSVPEVPAGTCPGRVLYAASNTTGSIQAFSDLDSDLQAEGQTAFEPGAGSGLGMLDSRRDGGVTYGTTNGTVGALFDDDGDFVADRFESLFTALTDSTSIASYRRTGHEYLFTADRFGDGRVLELVDEGAGFLPERITVFTDEPLAVESLTVDESGTLYVLDPLYEGGLGAIRFYRDEDGDGLAEVGGIFLEDAMRYGVIAARMPGTVFATDVLTGRVDRIIDETRDHIADGITTFASGLSLDFDRGVTFDAFDVLYVVVDGGTRVVALPDADHDGVADSQVTFSPLLSGLAGITFGPGPPEIVSPPGALLPVIATWDGVQLRLSWEDQGPTVPVYNIYTGGTVNFGSHIKLLCGVIGTADGQGSRYVDITPSDTFGRYYLVTASDACGEGIPGRSSAGVPRPLPGASCGPAPTAP